MTDKVTTEALGLRPEDFRSLWPRALGRIMGQLQEVTDDVQAANAGNKQLLDDALTTSKEGVENLNVVGRRLAATVKAAQESFIQAVDEKSGFLVSQMAKSSKALADAGEDLLLRAGEAILEPIDKLKMATARFEAAAAEAEISRAAASDARMKFMDYRRELDAHQALVILRLADAKVKAYAGLGFWARVWAVVSPPAVTGGLPPMPARPKSPKPSKP